MGERNLKRLVAEVTGALIMEIGARRERSFWVSISMDSEGGEGGAREGSAGEG
jgi:hypothetical protein